MWTDLFNCKGDSFNIEAVCPDYRPESQCSFTWYRDERGVAIVSGYGPEQDIDSHWLCDCGHYETGGCCCTRCHREPPWGCIGRGIGEGDGYDPDSDFGFFSEFEGDDGGDFVEFVERFEDESEPDYWLPGDILENGGWE